MHLWVSSDGPSVRPWWPGAAAMTDGGRRDVQVLSWRRGGEAETRRRGWWQ